METKEILDMLLEKIASIDEVRAIGMSGNKTSLPVVGEGDIDIFVYCKEIPGVDIRDILLNEVESIEDIKVNVFQEGHWGIADYASINGVETWIMYFTIEETKLNIDSILRGDYPDKLDNYYYPIGRCAMLKDINIVYDKDGFLQSMKSRLSDYPSNLANVLTQYHIEQLEDTEDLQRAATRKDVLFYHFALDLTLDHFLQALFALNKTYFPSRKRSIQLITKFLITPSNCSERLLEVVRLGGNGETLDQSYALWTELVHELRVKFTSPNL
jgi:hypothetical protein